MDTFHLRPNRARDLFMARTLSMHYVHVVVRWFNDFRTSQCTYHPMSHYGSQSNVINTILQHFELLIQHLITLERLALLLSDPFDKDCSVLNSSFVSDKTCWPTLINNLDIVLTNVQYCYTPSVGCHGVVLNSVRPPRPNQLSGLIQSII